MGDKIGSNNKRSRDEPADSSESKRIRELLQDDDDVDLGRPINDLDDVIRSLEKEIQDASKMDLGFLQEAADDELGLPPVVGSELSSLDGGDSVGVDDGGSGFNRIWGFEDEIWDPYQVLGDFGIDEREKGILDNGDLYDGGLFDCYGLDCGPLDIENL